MVLDIRGVAQLATGSTTNSDLMDGTTDIINESLSEGMHEVCVALQSCSALQHTGLVREQADVLAVACAGLAVPGPVSAEQTWVFFPTLQCTSVTVAQQHGRRKKSLVPYGKGLCSDII